MMIRIEETAYQPYRPIGRSWGVATGKRTVAMYKESAGRVFPIAYETREVGLHACGPVVCEYAHYHTLAQCKDRRIDLIRV